MKANEYQKLATRTLIEEPDFDIAAKDVMISWNALGLAGEAGEVVDLVKKGIYHQQGIDKTAIKKELGDVLWYLSALCKQFDFTLEEVMQHNIDKLNARFPDGYSPERTRYKKGDAE
ncbi:MAG: NTP pyrophosphatase (non-canonical NTP hydrolase) [Maribacter sp.]|jgi:NTP pyrophosphatase (non-canonical NTP hydrolase)